MHMKITVLATSISNRLPIFNTFSQSLHSPIFFSLSSKSLSYVLFFFSLLDRFAPKQNMSSWTFSSHFELVLVFLLLVYFYRSFFAHSIECTKVAHINIKLHDVCYSYLLCCSRSFATSLQSWYIQAKEYTNIRCFLAPSLNSVITLHREKWKKSNAIDSCSREKAFNLKCKSCDLCTSVLLCGVRYSASNMCVAWLGCARAQCVREVC